MNDNPNTPDDPNLGDTAKCMMIFGTFAPLDLSRDECRSIANMDQIAEMEAFFADICDGTKRFGESGRALVASDVPFMMVQAALPPEAIGIDDDWTLVRASIVRPGEPDVHVWGKQFEAWLYGLLATTAVKH